MKICPAFVPPTLIMIRRRLRPIVALARKPGPNTPAAQLTPSRVRAGPLITMRGDAAFVVPECPWRLKAGSHAASTTARTTGR